MRLAILTVVITMWAAGVAAQVQGAPLDQKRQLVEQKIRLLEMLLKSPAAKNSAGGGSGEGIPLAERGRRAIESARSALAESRIDEAQQLIDDALKSTSNEARRLQSGSALADDAQRRSYQNLVEQVATYRASVADLAKDSKVAPAARGLLARIDTQMQEARRHEATGRMEDANRVLSDTYKLAVGEISRLRAGQEVVMSLHFDTPAEEYAYEQRRFESGELMVGMLVAEGRAAGDRQVTVDGFSGEGRRLRDEAANLARNGKHKEAVGLMEQATGQMNRALQAMGVPVF